MASEGNAARTNAEKVLEEAHAIVAAMVKGEGAVWSLNRDTGAVRVFQGKVKDRPTPAFRAVGELHGISARDVLVRLVIHGEHRDKWNPTCGTDEDIETWTTAEKHYRIYHDCQKGAVGGLVSPRDFSEAAVWWIDEQQGGATRAWLIYCSFDDARCPPQPTTHTRGTVYPSGYLFEQTSPTAPVIAHSIVHVNLAGSLPYWIINKAIPGEVVTFYTAINNLFGNTSASASATTTTTTEPGN